jgi:Na+-transporting NADH:ubiquinone oxidoreductase subunit F
MSGIAIVLIAAGVACGLTTLLAALLLIAERYLADYGECRIDINEGAREMSVRGGESLLFSLTSQGLFIPSACGGRGTCAYCKVKLLGGGGPLLPTEEPLLTPEEIADSVRVSCQVKVRSDLAIRVPEELFSIREYRGRVESIRDMTHDIKLIRIAFIEPESIEFKPGQYVQLQAPAYGSNPEPVYRAYSIASEPHEDTVIELIIRLVPDGICTTWVFEHLKEGDEVLLNGPYGEFCLSDSDRQMAWIAGGSGMAPFWSMVRHMKRHDIARKCTYFFGAVQKRDLFLVEQLEKLADELDWFEFIPALSGPVEGDAWEGETGLITEVVGRHLGDGPQTEGYLCGSAGMIDASVKVLTECGVPETEIFYDKFN